MPRREERDLVVLGGGPAGLAAAAAARDAGAGLSLVEREDRLGGILKQCIHDGFGVARFGERLTGPEYARRDIEEVTRRGIDTRLGAFVSAIRRVPVGSGNAPGFVLRCVSRDGAFELAARALVLATGCRERTDRQVFIHGDRPAGVLTAGLAQHMVNVQGLLPGRRAVILGSGDIGLIVARRLVLEGIEVEGVYEIKNEPSGLSRNVRQCLDDFAIPLHLGATVTEVHGNRRVEGVTVASVDQRGSPLRGTERNVACDTLILSVGLIPENELALSLGMTLDSATRGPKVDQRGACLEEGLFCCGNALHVNDLADYVSESGAVAGRAAADYALGRAAARQLVPIKNGPGFLYSVPHFLDLEVADPAVLYFRSNSTLRASTRLVARAYDAAGEARSEILSKEFRGLRPPEMERVELDVSRIPDDTAHVGLALERRE